MQMPRIKRFRDFILSLELALLVMAAGLLALIMWIMLGVFSDR